MKNEINTRPPLNVFACEWFRHDKYEIIVYNGESYVRPAEGSQISFYRPFDNFPTIVAPVFTDFLALGRDVDLEVRAASPTFRPSPRTRNRALEFCRKHGVIGSFWQGIATCGVARTIATAYPDQVLAFDSTRAGTVSALSDRTLGRRTFAEYMRQFLCGAPFRITKNSVDEALARRGEFIGLYAEPVSLIERKAWDLYSRARVWTRFSRGNYSLDDLFVDENGTVYDGCAWREALERDQAHHVGLRVHFQPGGRRRVDYSFDSLISALQIMFVLSMASYDQQIQTCKECLGLFTPRAHNVVYCSEACSNRARQRAWKKRQEGKRQRKHHGAARKKRKD